MLSIPLAVVSGLFAGLAGSDGALDVRQPAGPAVGRERGRSLSSSASGNCRLPCSVRGALREPRNPFRAHAEFVGPLDALEREPGQSTLATQLGAAGAGRGVARWRLWGR